MLGSRQMDGHNTRGKWPRKRNGSFIGRGWGLFEEWTQSTQNAVPTPTPTRGFGFLSFPPHPLNSTGMPCPLMGSIMRSPVNHSSISLDRLSVPETIYWIPRSKWAFFLFSSVFRELFRGSVCPFCPCWAAFVPSIYSWKQFPESTYLLCPGFPQCLPNRLPSTVQLPHKPTSCFQLLNQGGSSEFYLQIFGGNQSRAGGGREEAHLWN